MAGNKRRRTSGGFHTTRGDLLSTVSPSSASQPTFLSTFDRASRYPIFHNLCDCLTIAEIVALTQTCKKFSGLYQYLLSSQWDVDQALRRYVEDPQGFRSQMARYDALISGNFAVQYFERNIWSCKRLVVYILQGRGSQLFSKYLSTIAGYSEEKLKEYGPDRPAMEVGISAMTIILGSLLKDLRSQTRTFKKDADRKFEIRLHSTTCLPAQYILEISSSTAVVNILSWNKAYSVFPLPTFIQHKSYLLHDLDKSARQSARKYSQRGWDVQGVMWPEEKRRNHPIRERRRVGDRYTWTIPFDTRKVEWSKTPDYVLEHACFEMDLSMNYDNEEFQYRNQSVRYYVIEANVLESKVLKHTYVYGGVDMIDFFFPRLHSFIISEIYKLDPAQRPTNYKQMLEYPGNIDGALGDFDQPASWTYRDDEFPKWYKAFEQYQPE